MTTSDISMAGTEPSPRSAVRHPGSRGGDKRTFAAVAELLEITKVRALFSTRRLAQYFDCYDEEGKPCTQTILEWWHSGRIPPPDIRLSRQSVYWRPETIEMFIAGGG